MRTRYFSLLFFLGITSVVFGQKHFTMAEAISGYHLYPRADYSFQWVDDAHFSRVSSETGESTMVIYQIEETGNGSTRDITLSTLNTALRSFDDDLDTFKSFPRVHWLDLDNFRLYTGDKYLKYNLPGASFSSLAEFDREGISNVKSHDATLNQAYKRGDDLYVKTRDGEEVKITDDGGDGIVYGEAVHRYEFGITEGIFWSEDGNSLAFYRKDETMVTEYPLYKLSEKPAEAEMVRYPVAGDPSHHATIGVHHLSSGQTIYLKTGEPKEQFLTNVAWSPDGKHIYVAIVNRAQNHMWLNRYNATDGSFDKTLFEETNEKYVEPEHPVQFLPNDPTKFIWWSERDGFNHIYLYNTEGKLLKQLTKGKWVVTQVHGITDDGAMMFISGTGESAIDRDLYCVNIEKAKMKRLTTDPGTHSITPSPGFKFFADRFSNTVTPHEMRLITMDGVQQSVIHKVDNPISDYEIAEMNIGTFKADDGTPLYYRVFKPIDFDPKKKYPAIVYLYNGPHAQMIRNSWMGGANLWYQYLAQRGYVVFTVDGRGSANRGFEFESAIFRNLGELEMNDQLNGLKWLEKQGYVDTSRLGIHGWSYGGFMTTSMMTRHPGVFKVGVAGGPVIDWRYYEIMYTERYMDTPEENPDGYDANNLLKHAGNLEGRLLMIHGAQDATVLWQHSLMYLQKSIELGVTGLDYYVYPHHEHNVRGPERVHLMEKVTEYLIDHLE